jgi:ferric-dicitrate binding protein FerR (iron transport regulator)
MLKTLDKKKLHINKANGKNYPEPDVPVQDAWENMQQLLQQVPAAESGFRTGKGKGFRHLGKGLRHFIYPAGTLVIVSAIVYVVSVKKEPVTSSQKNYNSETIPKADTLADGTIAFLDTLSSIAVTNPANEKKWITIKNGGCYFRQLNKNTGALWQLKVGLVEIIPNNANVYVSVDTVTAVAVVQVQTGSAEIQLGEKKLHIAAGESLRFNTQKDILYNKLKMDPNVFSYANRIFEFNDLSFKEAAGFLEKAYGVKFITENNNLYNCRITTRFDNKSIEEILDILAYTLSFEYTIDKKNNQVLISGDGCN